MTCQICYRATDGSPVYSTPVSSGPCSLKLDKAPNKGVVIAVICNTDYKYLGEATRKAHFDYRLKIGSGVTAADIYTKWFDVTLPTVSILTPEVAASSSSRIPRNTTLSVTGRNRNSIVLNYELNVASTAKISLYSPRGVLIISIPVSFRQPGSYKENIGKLAGGIAPGTYILKLTTGANSSFAKAFVVK
jgi:hypothetical protein